MLTIYFKNGTIQVLNSFHSSFQATTGNINELAREISKGHYLRHEWTKV